MFVLNTIIAVAKWVLSGNALSCKMAIVGAQPSLCVGNSVSMVLHIIIRNQGVIIVDAVVATNVPRCISQRVGPLSTLVITQWKLLKLETETVLERSFVHQHWPSIYQVSTIIIFISSQVCMFFWQWHSMKASSPRQESSKLSRVAMAADDGNCDRVVGAVVGSLVAEAAGEVTHLYME